MLIIGRLYLFLFFMEIYISEIKLYYLLRYVYRALWK